MDTKEIARIAYDVSRVYGQISGNAVTGRWAELSGAEQDVEVKKVEMVLSGQDVGLETLYNQHTAAKAELTDQAPVYQAYDQLPAGQRDAHILYVALVQALANKQVGGDGQTIYHTNDPVVEPTEENTAPATGA